MRKGQASATHAGGLGHERLELAKWFAIATMAADHYGKIVEPDLLGPTHSIGRASFPLFAAIVGLRLALSPNVAVRYRNRLLPWAVVSQPIFVLAGRSWFEGNILFTLVLGISALWAVDAWAAGRHGAAVLRLVAVLAFSAFAEFGPVGVLMIPAIAILARSNVASAMWLTGPLGLLANARLALPFLAATDATALLASPLLALSARFLVPLPRLPRHAFYAFYPGHLLALHFLDLYG